MVFCNTCYKKLFGPRGCGYGNTMVAAAGLQGEEKSLSRNATPSHKPGASTPSLMSSNGPKCVVVNDNAIEYFYLCPGVPLVSPAYMPLSVSMLAASSGTRPAWPAPPALKYSTPPHSMMLEVGRQSTATSATSWPWCSRRRGPGRTRKLRRGRGGSL